MSIKLTDAAKFYKELKHQNEAWNWLQGELSEETLETFASKYREAPKPPVLTPVSNTWEGIYQAGKQAGAKFPEVVAAQWALESGWGKHTSGQNNYFGLKGSGSTVNTQEFINGKWVTIKAGFLDFPDIQTCVTYLVDRWYKDYKHFKGVNRANTRNECAQLLVKEGYATDPDYATKVIQIMDRQVSTIPLPSKPDPVPAANPFLPSSPFSYKVTPNITYGEICLNQESRRFTQKYQCDTAIELCRFIEQVRKHFGGKPVIITSGHRPPAINASVGGASASEHLYNAPNVGAIDFFIKGVNIYDVEKYCDRHWKYSLGYGAPKGFVHLGIRASKQRIRWDY
jgi:hypothetical protein